MKQLLLLIILAAFLPISLVSQSADIEKFIHLNRENEEEYRRERELWIEEMHKTPPDLNWKVIENANHLAKIEKHQAMVNKYLSEGKHSKDMMLETIIGESGLRGEWIEKGSNNQAGRMHTADIDFDNHLIYAGSSGGNIWRGSLTGTDWTCLNNGLQIKGIIYVKVLKVGNKKRIVIASSSPSNVWYTDDEGLHWTSAKGLDKPHNWGSIRRGVWVNSRNELYILTTEWDYTLKKGITAIYRSTDYGENFKPVMKYDLSDAYCDIWAPEYDYAGVFLVHKDTLSKIEDGTITKLGEIKAGQKYSDVSRTFLRGSIINTNVSLSMLLVSKSKTESRVYRSHNLKNWYYIGAAPTRTFMGNSFNVSYRDTNLLFVGGMELWRSDDNGANWKHVNGWGQYYGDPKNKLHADIPGVVYLKSPQGADLFLVGTDGGLYISKDGMKTVENLSLFGLNVSQYYSGYTYRKSDSVYYLGSQDQGFQRTLNDQKDGASSFVQTISGDYGHLTSSDGGVNLWSVYPGFAMLYENANIPKHKTRTWSFKKVLKNWLWLPPIVADPEDPKSAYLVSGTKISSNNGANRIWHVTFNGSKMVYDSIDYDFRQGANNRKPASLAISPLATDFMYVLSNDGRFFMTSDRGKNWEMNEVFKGPGGHYFYGNSVVASADKFGRVYCAGNGYKTSGAYMSDDHGKTWTPIDSGLPKTLIYKIAVTPDDKFIFAASNAGPYVYIMDEGRWYDMSAPETPDQTFWSVEYVPHRKLVRFVTYGRGAWDFQIDKFTSDVKTKPQAALSSTISLYPNPMSISGTLRLSLNKPVNGKLLLYNLDGRMVKEIYSGSIAEGISEFKVDAYVEGNTKLTPGVYILFLLADGITNYTKVIIGE
jgi:photosystem II stability/assembly factor-like uncharacterized protein